VSSASLCADFWGNSGVKQAILILIAAFGLSACAVQPRTEPPAPIESSRARIAAPVPPRPILPEPPPPEEPEVEIYPYRAPGEAPEAVPVAETPVQPESPAPTMTSLQSERATAGLAEEGMAPLPSSPGAPASGPRSLASAPSPPAPTLPPATGALAQQAEQQRQSGDYVGAAATLERALRIEPREAYLWNRLARVRMEQGLHSQAGNLAERSNSLAGDEAPLKQDNWGMIAVSRRAGGDLEGATEAERKASGG